MSTRQTFPRRNNAAVPRVFGVNSASGQSVGTAEGQNQSVGSLEWCLIDSIMGDLAKFTPHFAPNDTNCLMTRAPG